MQCLIDSLEFGNSPYIDCKYPQQPRKWETYGPYSPQRSPVCWRGDCFHWGVPCCLQVVKDVESTKDCNCSFIFNHSFHFKLFLPGDCQFSCSSMPGLVGLMCCLSGINCCIRMWSAVIGGLSINHNSQISTIVFSELCDPLFWQYIYINRYPGWFLHKLTRLYLAFLVR